jgi:hypothetical protein
LKYICKRFEANKKIRKRKEEKKIKLKMGLGKPFSPAPYSAQGPAMHHPETVSWHFPPPDADDQDPPVRPIFHLGPEFSPVTESPPLLLPSSIPLLPALTDA